MPKIKTASRLANVLTNQFLQDGNFELAGSPTTEITQAVTSADLFDHQTFANLSVQAVGFSEGGKADDDEEELPDAVYIYVTKGTKKAFKELPVELEGIPVVIDSIGKVIVRPHAAVSNRGHIFERDSRIACGSSCAPSGKDYSGTFGAIVKKKNDPDRLYVLSNNHVTADCNHLSVGMPILAPSSKDGRQGNAPRQIGEHAEMTELRSGIPVLVTPCRDDLAIAGISDENAVSSWQGDNDGFDTPMATSNPLPGMKVKKFGRTTGLTHGRIQSSVVRTPVRYESDNFKAIVWFQGVWVVRPIDSDPFAVGGDSGSLVVTEDGSAAVGIVFSANNRGDYVNIIPIDRVLAAFGGLELVADHGT